MPHTADTNNLQYNTLRPPLVSGLPLLGSALSLLHNPHEFVKKSYKQYGNVFRFRAAHQKYIILAGQDANRFVAGKGKDCFTVEGFWGEAFEHMGCPHGAVGVDGDIHKFQRKLMSPHLVQSAFKDRIPDLANPIQDLVARHRNKKRVRFAPLSRHMISNQIGYNLQGYKTSHEKVEQMIYHFGSVMNVFGLRKWPKFMLYTPKVLLAEAVTKKHVARTLTLSEQRPKEDKQHSPQYLDDILPAMKARPEWFTEGDMGMHALLPFVGALDTVAATMGFMVFRLLNDSALYKRIQAEVDTHFSSGIPDLTTLRSMRDLNGLVKETMRLQPTGFGITRTAAKDFVFQNHQIYKGESVIIFTTADHTNPDYFPNPEHFDINRNNKERNEFKQPAFAPYGKGPHNCIGASLADIMMPLNMGLILHQLTITAACDLNKVKVTFNPAPVLSNNFKVNFSSRSGS